MMCVYPSMHYAEDERSKRVKGLTRETIKKMGISICGILIFQNFVVMVSVCTWYIYIIMYHTHRYSRTPSTTLSMVKESLYY